MGENDFRENSGWTVEKKNSFSYKSTLRTKKASMVTRSLPLIQRAQILGDVIYSPMAFAKLLGISKHDLLEKEAKGILPPAKRDSNQERYYKPEDVSKYRAYLGLPSPLPSIRKQLFLNFKGGTGKSTISASYGFRLAQMGARTLLIDLDPQGHLTQCLGLNSQQFPKTLFHALIEKEEIEKIIVKTDLPTLDIIPSNLNLSPVELSLFSMNSREFRLRRLISSVEKNYELIVMDASPSIGLLNLNAILASNDLIIPVLADFLSYHGLKILFETLSTIEEDFSFVFENIFIFLNRYNESHRICKRSKKALETHYDKYLLSTVIRQDTKIAEATSQGSPIFLFAQSSKGAADIQSLIDEILEPKGADHVR
jgi:chromosome partitioning protein